MLVDYAIDKGVNLFDTADSYSGGKSKEIFGKVLHKKRKDVLISTKIRFGVSSNNVNDSGLSRYHIIKGCNDNLKRLGTDYIDIYLLHAYDQAVPLEETLSALDDLVRQGKVSYTGCSNGSCFNKCTHGVYKKEENRTIVVGPTNCIENCSGYQELCPSEAIGYAGGKGKDNKNICSCDCGGNC
jgi:predicted oxidoreductase